MGLSQSTLLHSTARVVLLEVKNPAAFHMLLWLRFQSLSAVVSPTAGQVLGSREMTLPALQNPELLNAPSFKLGVGQT